MSNAFAADERARMLALKGVGPTVIQRLEELGFTHLAQLANEESGALTLRIARHMGSTCWHNSPQARAAINAIIALAKADDVTC
ncbi:MAG: hypothetical protein LWW81_02110 [Rhodocyclales bacterium]|nr:hypothetical protein [Rhodocyclales bacterium]